MLSGDQIWVGNVNRNTRIYGIVQHVSSNEIQMKLRTSDLILQQQPIYSIHFEVNRLTFRLQRLALDTAKRLAIVGLLFPQRTQLNLLKKVSIPM